MAYERFSNGGLSSLDASIDNNDLIVVLDDHLQQLFLAVPGRHFARYAAGRHQYRSIIRLQWE